MKSYCSSISSSPRHSNRSQRQFPVIKFYAKDQLNLAAQDDGDDDDYFLQQ